MDRILFTAAAGALAMYFLDPQGGRRRRVRTRDKAERVTRRMRDAYDVTLRDTRHRAMGIKASAGASCGAAASMTRRSPAGCAPRLGATSRIRTPSK